MHRLSTAGWTLWTTTGLLAIAGGCESGAGRSDGLRLARMEKDAASRLLPGAETAEVQPIATRVFRRHFSVDDQISSGSRLVSRPLEFTELDHPERLRDVLRPSPNRRREIAVLDLRQEGPSVRIRCGIHIQRLDTAEHQAFVAQRGDDRPDDTPIDRAGASGVSQQEQWVNVGRDRQLEQEILDAIEQELTSPPGP